MADDEGRDQRKVPVASSGRNKQRTIWCPILYIGLRRAKQTTMTRREETEKELTQIAKDIELHVTSLSHLAEVLQEAAFSITPVDPSILDEIRVEMAKKMANLEALRAESFVVAEEHKHLIRGAVSAKKFGF